MIYEQQERCSTVRTSTNFEFISFGLIVLFILTGIYGWFANIGWLFNLPYGFTWTEEVIIRVVGMFVVPLGAIMGLFF